MRYLITGAAGFIASAICQRLLNAGHQVTAVDNLNDAYDRSLKEWRLERLQSERRFNFVLADISDRDAIDSLLGTATHFDAVINLAARAGVRYSVVDPWVYYQTNVLGTLNLLDLCKRHGIPKFVLASTSSLYGSSRELPYRETLNTDQPLSPYAASKKGAEALCYSYNHLHGIDVSIVRYFTVYGPAGRPDMSVFRFVKDIHEGVPITVYGDGTQSRDFTFVDDIAAGTVAALEPVGCRVFNLGSNSPVELKTIIHTIENLVGRKATIHTQPAHKADARRTWADVSRAGAELGWTPKVRVQDGLSRCVDWYLENRSWASRISTSDAPSTEVRHQDAGLMPTESAETAVQPATV